MKRKKNQCGDHKKTKKKKTNEKESEVKEMCPWWFEQKESFSKKLSTNNLFYYRFKEQDGKKKRINIGGQMSKDKVKENEVIRTLSVRLKPSKEQKVILQKLFDVHISIYNRTIDFIRKPEIDSMDKRKIRDHLMDTETKHPKRCKIYQKINEKEVPLDLKREAIQEASFARDTSMLSLKALNEKNSKKHRLKSIQMKYKSYHDCSKSFIVTLHHKKSITWNEDGVKFFPTIFEQPIPFMNKKDILKLNGDKSKFAVTVKYTSPGVYHIHIPQIFKKQNVHTGKNVTYNQHGVIDCIGVSDPGVRVFQAVYSPFSNRFENHSIDTKRLMSLKVEKDKLKSVISKSKGIQKKKRKLMKQKENKYQKIIKDSHHKLSTELSKRYKHFIIPVFNVSDMIQKKDKKTGRRRCINKTTVKNMLNLGHYKFRQMLKFKGEQYGSNVYEVQEHYTSKCCSDCGVLDRKLGSKKTYNCKWCGMVQDRDFNAAKNIWLKNYDNLCDKIIY